MIIRFVKLTIKSEFINSFQHLFEERNSKIASFPGCVSVELLHDIKDNRVFFTYSKWEKESDLNHYRNSDFFGETWSTVKPMFDAKPEAWSLLVVETKN
jgi:heme-degrading monooxygenase HmoA